ncbi:acyl-CoA thioesterase [Acinetobacter sp. ANC 3813]|uniref:acyl-CoA thioesterase n=1 Tax=Acinetobacter sp. ANC 3813 TaxID=1977873 RepID=UPI000A345EF4|nr:thioesterase family protein [Acinetobacter sp. ANC 3813]OTG86825.1 thioesterase [Acinetobacter sp. ANC 3813]
MIELNDYPLVYEQNVAWGDMDAFGHVNNVQYYRYIESARICYFDELGILDQDVLTVVASSQCKYLNPIFYPDHLKIGVRVEELRNSAVRMSYLIWSTQLQKAAAIGEAVIVCVDKVNMQKTAMPEIIREKIKQIEMRVQHKI